VRTPFINAPEYPVDYDPISATSIEKSKAHVYVYVNRWKPLTEAVQSFDIAVFEAETIFGIDITQKTEVLRSCVTTLYASVKLYLDYLAAGGKGYHPNVERKNERYNFCYAGSSG